MKWKQLLAFVLMLGHPWISCANAADTPHLNGTISMQSGSSVASQVSKVRVGIEQAVQAAGKIQPGKVIKVELEEEAGFLVWEVEVVAESGKTVELLIDPGTGELLGREQGN